MLWAHVGRRAPTEVEELTVSYLRTTRVGARELWDAVASFATRVEQRGVFYGLVLDALFAGRELDLEEFAHAADAVQSGDEAGVLEARATALLVGGGFRRTNRAILRLIHSA